MSSAEPPGAFDLGHPVVQFIQGVLDIFYGANPADPEVAADPTVIKRQVDQLISLMPAPPRVLGMAAEEQATGMMAAASEAADGETALDYVLAALALWPDCTDAYSYLGASVGDELSVAIPMFTLGMIAGYNALGQAFFQEHEGHFWAMPEARPFMHALSELARANRDAGALDAAAMHYTELLRLNPSDEQGVRYDLATMSLEAGQYPTYRELRAFYAEDASPAFTYGDALCAFAELGDAPESRSAMKVALASNAHVAAFITGSEQLPEDVVPEFVPGDRTEGAVFADMLMGPFHAVEGALAWLTAEATAAPAAPAAPALTLVKPPDKEKRSGPRQIE